MFNRFKAIGDRQCHVTTAVDQTLPSSSRYVHTNKDKLPR